MSLTDKLSHFIPQIENNDYAERLKRSTDGYLGLIEECDKAIDTNIREAIAFLKGRVPRGAKDENINKALSVVVIPIVRTFHSDISVRILIDVKREKWSYEGGKNFKYLAKNAALLDLANERDMKVIDTEKIENIFAEQIKRYLQSSNLI